MWVMQIKTFPGVKFYQSLLNSKMLLAMHPNTYDIGS